MSYHKDSKKWLLPFLGLWIAIVFVNLNLYGCKGPDKPSDPPVVTQPEPPSEEPIPDTPLPQDPPPVTPDPGPDPDPEPIPPVEEPEDPEEPVVPIPLDPLKTLKFNVTFYGSSATASRKAKYQRAICVAKKVIAEDAFKSKILSYDSPYTTNTFYDTNQSNAEIVEKIGKGNETLQPTIDNELDVEIEFYYAATSTVGYTYATSKRVWVNTKFFDGYTPSSVAANLVHEWLHKLGYKHAVSYSASRDYSVPYGIGSMVRSLGKKYESTCN